jgi:hypothetical protein
MFVKHALAILLKPSVSSFMTPHGNDLKYEPNKEGISVQKCQDQNNDKLARLCQ